MEENKENVASDAIDKIIEQIERIKDSIVDKDDKTTLFAIATTKEVDGHSKLIGSVLGNHDMIVRVLRSAMESQPQIALPILEATFKFLSLNAEVIPVSLTEAEPLFNIIKNKMNNINLN